MERGGRHHSDESRDRDDHHGKGAEQLAHAVLLTYWRLPLTSPDETNAKPSPAAGARLIMYPPFDAKKARRLGRGRLWPGSGATAWAFSWEIARELFEGAGEPGSLNHLGIEVESTDDMQAAQRRLTASDFDTNTQDGVTCC